MMKQIAGILVLFIALTGLSGVAQAQTNVLYSGSGDPVDCPVASDGSIGSIKLAHLRLNLANHAVHLFLPVVAGVKGCRSSASFASGGSLA